MRNLIIDVGNSAVKIALFDGNVLVEQWRVTQDVLPNTLTTLAKDTTIRVAIISSVTSLCEKVEQAIHRLPFPCLRMSARLRMPFTIDYKTPDTLGPDRLAALVGAYELQPNRNLLVIDVGTAITYDLVTSNGIYLGGNISPGINMRLKALNLLTDKLPLVDKEGVRVPIGHTTETAIREGVLQGIDKEIEGYIHEYTLKFPDLLVFLTGGDMFLLDNRVKSRTFADSLLVTKGLNRILMLNNEAF